MTRATAMTDAPSARILLLSLAYPNVAAEPSMYWPSVRSIPRGPGPCVMMLQEPKMKPMVRPTAGGGKC